MNSPLLIRLALLQTLEVSSPGSMSADLLLKGVNTEAPKPLTEADLAEHLGWLKDAHLVAMLGNPLDPTAARWVITNTGRSALQQ